MTRSFELLGHVCVFLTLAFTVYGQVVLKWQMQDVGPLPEGGGAKLLFLLRLLANPWILSGMIGAFLASLSWMAAMTRLEMSYAYPFMSLAFVVVMVLGAALFQETIGPAKIAGTLLVIAGLVVIARA